MKSKLFIFTVILILFSLTAKAQMVLVFDTNLSEGTTIELPLWWEVDVIVDWGDGDSDVYTTEGNKPHTYTTEGEYTVTITGSLRAFGSYYENSEKLTKVTSWDNLGLENLNYAFYYAMNIIEVPASLPSTVIDIHNMFYFAEIFNQDISTWDVSNITHMGSLFNNAHSFNQDISGWNVSNVQSTSQMFQSANAFNQDISNWDVSNVVSMYGMFSSAISFNQDISNWDVGNVTNMGSMFSSATNFNQDISSWNVGTVANMRSMFSSANNFDQDISNWNVSNVTDMTYMFAGTQAFNQDINSWNVGNVTSIRSMFNAAVAFNQDIGNWDVSNVTDMQQVFHGASAFDQDLSNWNVSNVTNMISMFALISLSTSNYDALLLGWSAQTLKPYIDFHGGNSQYSSNAVNARAILTDAPNNWTVTDGGCVGIDKLQDAGISVYPNPTNGIIFINTINNNIQNITISDITGKLINANMEIQQNKTINLSNLKSGIYILKIQTDEKTFSIKIMKN